MRDVVEEKDGLFILPLAGMRAEAKVGLREALVVRDEDDEAEISVPAALEELTAALIADSAVVLEARASREGRLEVTFSGGRVLSIDPLPHVEAWEVRGPGFLVVCTPGGGEPAIWDARAKTYTIRAGEPLPPELTKMIESFGMPMPLEEPKGEDE